MLVARDVHPGVVLARRALQPGTLGHTRNGNEEAGRHHLEQTNVADHRTPIAAGALQGNRADRRGLVGPAEQCALALHIVYSCIHHRSGRWWTDVGRFDSIEARSAGRLPGRSTFARHATTSFMSFRAICRYACAPREVLAVANTDRPAAGASAKRTDFAIGGSSTGSW